MIDNIFLNVLRQIEKYPYGFWNDYKNRETAAKQCHSKTDYKIKYPGAYTKTIRIGNGEIDKFEELFFDKKTTYPKGYWNSFEHRLSAAKECKSLKEYLKKFPGSYSKSALVKGEMQYLRDNVFVLNPTPKNYWKDYKRREEAASKCCSKSEYAQKYPVAYSTSRKNIDEFNDFVERFFTNTFVDDESKIYLIYVYLDETLKIAYCGLTRQTIGMRDCQHRKKSDRLYQLFVNEYHTNIPKPIVIKENLNRIEAQEAEDYYINFYKKQGYTVLNSGHTGANIGSIGYTFKYNKKRCNECAIKCKSIAEFRKKYKKEYYSAYKNGWLNEYDWLEKEKFKKDISYEECAELAKTCKSITEFGRKFPSEIIIARKNNWLYDFFEEPVRWPYDACEKESKKYTKRSDFRRYSPSAYVVSQRNHWLENFTWLKVKKLKCRTFETFLNDVLKYNTKLLLKENDYETFEAMGKRKLYDCFYEKDGYIKENLKLLKIDSEDYNKLKQKVNERINEYLNKHNKDRRK